MSTIEEACKKHANFDCMCDVLHEYFADAARAILLERVMRVTNSNDAAAIRNCIVITSAN